MADKVRDEQQQQQVEGEEGNDRSPPAQDYEHDEGEEAISCPLHGDDKADSQ